MDCRHSSAPSSPQHEGSFSDSPTDLGTQRKMRSQAIPNRISVVIATKDRGSAARRTIESVLCNPYADVEVILVDQSVSDDTASSITPLLKDDRVRYFRSETVGVSAAKNIALQVAKGSIIACTDDDCEVPSDWLERIVRSFEESPQASVLFGSVDAAPHNDDGFIPAYSVQGRVLTNRLARKHWLEGLGACFAFRAALWDELGGFDERLGAGGHFHSAEEVDFVVRALAIGRTVGETPEFGVVHFGFRRWDQADDLIKGHMCGLGAMAAKHVRLYRARYLYVLARLGIRWLFGRPVVDFQHQPPRWMRLRAFLGGFGQGWRTDLGVNGLFAPGVPARPKPSGSADRIQPDGARSEQVRAANEAAGPHS